VILLIDAEAYQRTKSSQAPYLHKKPSYAVIDERTSLLAFVNAENAYYFIISVRLSVLIFQNISAARTEKIPVKFETEDFMEVCRESNFFSATLSRLTSVLFE
jgi:hypothetical protein